MHYRSYIIIPIETVVELKGSPYNGPWTSIGRLDLYLYTLFNLRKNVDAWPTPRLGNCTPGHETRYPIYRMIGGPRGDLGGDGKSSLPPGCDHRTAQLVSSRCTDWAITAHVVKLQALKNKK